MRPEPGPDLPPHDVTAEAGALACVLSADGKAAELLTQLCLDDFYDIRHRALFQTLDRLRQHGKPLASAALGQALRDAGKLRDAGGLEYVSTLPDQTPSAANFPTFLETLIDRRTRRAVLRDAGELASLARDASIPGSVIANAAGKMAEGYSRRGDGLLWERLEKRRFRVGVKPADPMPLFMIGRTPICTPGNLTAISGPPKTAKSAAVSAMIASAIVGLDTDRDCLGFASENPDGRAIIHWDTEQCEFDHWQLGSKTLQRSGVSEAPPWLLSYSVSGFTIQEARAAVAYTMGKAAALFGGVHSIHLDGVADLVRNPNDPEESNEFVNELQGLAIKYHCAIVCVIHLNPNTEKTRGHLGSQLERKAETNLRLERDGEHIVLWADKNRRAPISKSHGPRFVWSADRQMFVSAGTAAAAKLEVERGELAEAAEFIFDGRSAMTRSELETTVRTRLKVSRSSAYRKVNRMIELGRIKKTLPGLYVITSQSAPKAA